MPFIGGTTRFGSLSRRAVDAVGQLLLAQLAVAVLVDGREVLGQHRLRRLLFGQRVRVLFAYSDRSCLARAAESGRTRPLAEWA